MKYLDAANCGVFIVAVGAGGGAEHGAYFGDLGFVVYHQADRFELRY